MMEFGVADFLEKTQITPTQLAEKVKGILGKN